MTNSSGGRGRDQGARRGASPARKGGAGSPKRVAAPRRDSGSKDQRAAAPRRATGSNDQRAAAARRDSGSKDQRAAAPRRATGSNDDRAALPRLGPDDEWPYAKARERGRTAREGGMRRGQPPRRQRLAPDDQAARRREGEVRGPFTRRKGTEPQAEAERGSSYRLKSTDRKTAEPKGKATRSRRRSGAPAAHAMPTAANRRRRPPPTEATEELRRLAGRQADRALDALAHAGDAFSRGRERDALRILRPLVDTYPRAAAVRELAGLCRYRLGMYPGAADDLQVFVDLTGSTEQHPVLMDCRRAQRRLHDVEELWEELREVSPSAALVTEGRIVYAGALADAGRMTEAIDLLARRLSGTNRPQEHTLRLWYTLADLYDRSGDLPRARSLFEQVRRHDTDFADVAERLAALS